MKEGDKWQLFIPSELAYGDRRMGKHIKPGSVLLFDIEILKVNANGLGGEGSLRKRQGRDHRKFEH
jgi:hypothetical protein